MIDNEAMKTLLDTARQGLGAQEVSGGNVPFVLVPAGYKAQVLSELVFNDHAATPERTKQSVTVFDPESFAEYFGLFRDINSRVFADEEKRQILAVLDYHNAGKPSDPRWGQHRVTLTLRHSEQWKTWTGKNNQQFTQQQFAEFLEQNAIDIREPSPASIREMAGDLQATTEVDFGSSQRMNDGQVRFKYTETTKTTVGGSAVTVPDHFTIEVPVFVGAAPASVYAFLRYRIKEQKLVFWYTLLRPEEVVQQMFIAARDTVETNIGTEIINGVPA